MQNEVYSVIKDLKKLLGGWAWVRFWKTIQSSQQRTDTFGEPLGVPVIKPTHSLNQPGGTGYYPGKPKKKNFLKFKVAAVVKEISSMPVVAGSITGFSRTTFG